jgi:hypothetical protein
VLNAQEAFAGELDGIGTRDSVSDTPDVPVGLPETGDRLAPSELVESAMPDGSIFTLTVR